jgi:hypothetical protein
MPVFSFQKDNLETNTRDFNARMNISAVQTSQTQEVEIQWSVTFGGTESDKANALVQTADGGFVLAGYTRSYGTGSEDMWLVKTDANGQHEWNSTFGGIEDDRATSLVQTSDGGFAIAGSTEKDFYTDGMLLVKTDANGQHEWNTTLWGTKGAYSLIQASDGGFVLAGSNGDMYLVKTDANGQYEWDTTFGGFGDDVANSLIQASDGGFLLAGNTRSYGAGMSDMLLVKTNANGQQQWYKPFGGPADDRANSMIQTVDGGFLLAGNTYSYGAEDGDMWLVKTDVNGQHEWNTTIGGTKYDGAKSLIQISDGGFLLAGITYSYGDDWNNDMWLVKTNATGQHEWDIAFGESGNDYAESMIQTSDGACAIAGLTQSYGNGWPGDMWLVKTSEIPITEITTTTSTRNITFGWNVLLLLLTLFAMIPLRSSRKSS